MKKLCNKPYPTKKHKEQITRLIQREVSNHQKVEAIENQLKEKSTHPLEIYRHKYSLSYGRLALKIHVPRTTIQDYIKGKYQPSERAKAQIAQQTQGEIAIEAWNGADSKRGEGNLLEQYRIKYGLTYKKLGELMHLSPQVLYNYSTGKIIPSERVKKQIAQQTQGEIPVEGWPPAPPRKKIKIKSLMDERKNHPLELYRQNYCLSYNELAKLLGISHGLVCSHIKGISRLSHSKRANIAQLTGGEVGVDDWPLAQQKK